MEEEFPFQPPASLGKPKAFESSFDQTVARNICKSLGPEKGAWALAALGQKYKDRTGENGIATRDLNTLGFPFAVTTIRCKISEPFSFFEKFASTPLYAAWEKLTETDLWWGQAEARALAFHWVGWKVCVLHNVNWVIPTCGRLLLPDPSNEEDLMFIDPIVPWAQSAGWTF